jgi:LysR family transcriptional regulator, nitrogen assimilation regulatory protein
MQSDISDMPYLAYQENPMQINDLRLFIEVAELGSFTKVAAQRSTVQSHISRQISEIEKDCGAPLFRRTGRGVVLTEFGVHVQNRVSVWLKESDELFADIQQTSKVPMGEVKIGVLPSAAHPLMTHVFTQLHHEFPKIRLNIREGQGSELDAMLDTGGVDMAVLFRYEKPNGQDEALLATASTYLVSSPGLPLTSSDSVDFKRLEGLPLVLPRRPSHWRSILDETARSKGFNLQAEVEADSLNIQKEVIASNPHLYALLGPFSVDDEIRMKRLQAAKIISPDLKRYVTLAHSKQGHLTQASRIVSKLIKETVRNWGSQLNTPN